MSKPQRVEKRANSLVLFSVLFFGGLTQRPGKVKGILIGGQVQKYLVDRVDVDVLGRHKLQVHAVNLRGHLQVAGHAGHGGDVLHLQALGSLQFRHPLLHLKEPGPPENAQGLHAGGHRQADGAVRPALICHHQVGGEGVQAPVHALHRGIDALEIKLISALFRSMQAYHLVVPLI